MFRWLGCLLIISGMSLSASADQFDWLEDLSAHRSQQWARDQNEIAKKKYRDKDLERKIYDKLVYSKTIFPQPSQLFLIGDEVYFFEEALLKKQSVAQFFSGDPAWEIVLDLDDIRVDEGIPWEISDAQHLDGEKILIFFSHRGSDEVEMIEFDLKTKSFVPGGFSVPRSRTQIEVIDANTLLVATTSDSNTRFTKNIKLWKRGQRLKDAPILFTGSNDDLFILPYVLDDGVIACVSDKWDNETYYLIDSKVSPRKINAPITARLVGGAAFAFQLKKDEVIDGDLISQGSIVYKSSKDFLEGVNKYTTIFVPQKNQVFAKLVSYGDVIYIKYFDNLVPKLKTVTLLSGGRSIEEESDLGLDGFSNFDFFKIKNNLIFDLYGWLVPRKRIVLHGSNNKFNTISVEDPLPNYSGIEAKRLFAQSKDGTMIPYTVIAKKEALRHGNLPTILGGYGGFRDLGNVSKNLGAFTKFWIHSGGAQVVANIRGGAEFGLDWHQQAALKNKQKSYDDFIAVAEDLIKRGITSSQKLGIKGASNGGLLVASVMVQRPELFKAVLSDVPLTDMLEFHKKLIGAQWIHEYGDPDDPQTRVALLKYSPYHNIKKGVKYPATLFITTRNDDRVHPVHARKMYSKMKSFGQEAYYYESEYGGHTGGDSFWLESLFFIKELGL